MFRRRREICCKESGTTTNQCPLYIQNSGSQVFTLNAYQGFTKEPLWDKRLSQMTVISPNERPHFEQALRREVDVVVRQYSKMYELKEPRPDKDCSRCR